MASKYVIEVGESNFKEEVIESSVPVLVDFWAEWCGPCKALGPTLEAIANDFDGGVKIAKLNVDDNISLATEYRVTAIPLLLLFKGGVPVESIVGNRPKADLVETLQKHM